MGEARASPAVDNHQAQPLAVGVLGTCCRDGLCAERTGQCGDEVVRLQKRLVPVDPVLHQRVQRVGIQDRYALCARQAAGSEIRNKIKSEFCGVQWLKIESKRMERKRAPGASAQNVGPCRRRPSTQEARESKSALRCPTTSVRIAIF